MPGNPLTDPNWADDTTDTVVKLVGNVRDKTTKPLIYAARGAVFGIIGAILGVFALILLLIMLPRIIQALLDLVVADERSVYISYFAAGGIFCLAGLFLFSKRKKNAA